MANAPENTVSSEIFQDGTLIKGSVKGKNGSNNVVTNFPFERPSYLKGSSQVKKIRTDKDGDLVVERRKRNQFCVLHIEHSPNTSLELVGLQVWRGALLLADYILHYGDDLFKNTSVLEVGAGTGLTSIVASMFAKQVVCTDVDIGGILDLIKTNAEVNKEFVKSKFTVIGLDFFNNDWSLELEEKMKEIDIILAADVVYDVDLTEAFIHTLLKMMSIPPRKALYFALEKRYVFTTEDLDAVAPIYEHFLMCLEKEKPSSWTVQQLDINFPQYFQYKRVKQLVLWRISS